MSISSLGVIFSGIKFRESQCFIHKRETRQKRTSKKVEPDCNRTNDSSYKRYSSKKIRRRQKMTKISKDTPLAELTLRKYEKPYTMSRRDLMRKICLSTGLLQPGDSRDSIVDIF